MTRTLLAGIDLGTGGCKVTVIDETGALVDSAFSEIPTRYPHAGWSEQDPAEWLRACRDAFTALTAHGRFRPAEIAALATDGSTHNAVLMDREGRLLRPAIMWTDQRSKAQVQALEARAGARILEVAMNPVNPTWTLPQLVWVAEEEPELFRKVARISFTKDYLRSWLCGDWQTDWIEAAGSLFFDPRARRWSEEMCALAGLPPSVLPPIADPTAVAGRLTAEAASALGLVEGTPVVVGASDTAVEDYGAGAVKPGQAIVKLATAGNYNVMTNAPRPSRRLITYPQVIDGLWYQVSATNACASSVRWFRDVIGRPEAAAAAAGGPGPYARLDAQAAATPLGADGLLFQPYLLGERSPYWDPDLRGSFVGLTLRHSPGHLFRAVLEGIALSLADCARALEESGLPVTDVRIIGGGAASPLWRQIVCDVLGRPVAKPLLDDASFGSALLAGVGVGVYPDPVTAVTRAARVETTLTPDPSRHARYRDLFAVYRRLHDALAEIDHDLGRFAAQEAR